MTRFVAVDIAEGTVQLFQRDLNPAFDVGNIIPAQHNQRAMAGAAFGVARKLNADHFGVGGFDRFIGGHDVRPGAGAGAEDADRAIAFFELHRLQQRGIHVGDDQPEGVANGGPDKFR